MSLTWALALAVLMGGTGAAAGAAGAGGNPPAYHEGLDHGASGASPAASCISHANDSCAGVSG
eukprot:9333671-Pyramimonas_sp.AAC.1